MTTRFLLLLARLHAFGFREPIYCWSRPFDRQFSIVDVQIPVQLFYVLPHLTIVGQQTVAESVR